MGKRFELFEEDLRYWIHDHKMKINYTDFDLDCLTDLLNGQDERINKLNQRINELIEIMKLKGVEKLMQENQCLKNIQRSSKMLCRAINLVIDVYLKASELKFPNMTKDQLMDLCLSFIKDEIDWFLEITKKKK